MQWVNDQLGSKLPNSTLAAARFSAWSARGHQHTTNWPHTPNEGRAVVAQQAGNHEGPCTHCEKAGTFCRVIACKMRKQMSLYFSSPWASGSSCYAACFNNGCAGAKPKQLDHTTQALQLVAQQFGGMQTCTRQLLAMRYGAEAPLPSASYTLQLNPVVCMQHPSC